MSGNPIPFSKETGLTIAGTAVGITDSVHTPTDGSPVATAAVVTVETAPIRFWIDGSTPTASQGHLAQPGAEITLESHAEVKNFLAIRSTATSATAEVTVLR